MNTDTTIITTVAAVAAPFVTAVLQREHWSSNVKRWVAIAVSLVLAGIVVGVTRPTGIDVWTVLGMVLGGSTVVYAAVYPAANKITQSGETASAAETAKATVAAATTKALSTADKLDAVITEALTGAESTGVVSADTVKSAENTLSDVVSGVKEAAAAAEAMVPAASAVMTSGAGEA